MLQYTFSLISEKTCHINSHEYLCRATASISVDFQNVLQYSIRRKKRETARGTLMIICVVLPRVWASIFKICCITAYAEKKRDCLGHSHDYLCRATASMSVDFRDVLHYSIRRKKESALSTFFFSWCSYQDSNPN